MYNKGKKMSKKEDRYLGNTALERQQILAYHGKRIRKYNDLLNQDKVLMNWVYELDELYWCTQVREKKNVERGKNANER